VKILAETASNHNGDLNYLKKLIKNIEVFDNLFITAQIIDPISFCGETYEKYDFVKKISFNYDQWEEIFDFIKNNNHKFIPCPCDIKSLEFCLSKKFDIIKIHGSDLLNIDMLDLIKENKPKILLETQFATDKDIDFALERIGKNKIEALIHGFSNYPTEGSLTQLNSLDYMKKKWGLNVGFADHTTDTTNLPLMALAKNSTWLEKHITLSRNLRLPDWQPSLEPLEFTVMMKQLSKYSQYLGNFKKHPSPTEINMRKVMYKKYVQKGKQVKILRAKEGSDFWSYNYSFYSDEMVVAAIVARLKSTRLKKKVLLPFHNDAMVFDLINYVQKSKSIKKTVLATSFLPDDDELEVQANKRNIQIFRGEPLDVTRRLIDLAESYKAKALFRITGDMPFADPMLMDEMNKLRLENDLDYVRAQNMPLGMSAELFKIDYLMKLYLNNPNPDESEYLGWFVILDKEAKKGCLSVEYKDINLDHYSLTVDYQQDLDICKKLLKKIGKKNISNINLIDILNNINELEKVDLHKKIKLPRGKTMKYYEYLSLQKNQGYIINTKYVL